MSETIIKKIEKRINKFPKGKIIFIKDFAGIGNNEAVRQSLKRLVEKGKLRKLSQGIYYKPEGKMWLKPLFLLCSSRRLLKQTAMLL